MKTFYQGLKLLVLSMGYGARKMSLEDNGKAHESGAVEWMTLIMQAQMS